MAEKVGRFNRFLNAIGIVEVPEEPPQSNGDYYANDYGADNYGRQPSYVPPRNRTGQAPRTPSPRQGSTRPGAMVNPRSSGYVPTRPSGGDRYGGRSAAPDRTGQGTAGGRSQYPRGGERRPANAPRQSSPNGYDYSSRPPRQQSEPQTAPRSRTVMLSLQELTDCCDVIDNLILNNTVVLTMDDMDDRTMQRAVDTLSGAVFALHATFRRASAHTFLIAPSGVEVNNPYDPDYRF